MTFQYEDNREEKVERLAQDAGEEIHHLDRHHQIQSYQHRYRHDHDDGRLNVIRTGGLNKHPETHLIGKSLSLKLMT